uniref:Ig-like domain-containing protein n=2 Tax=Eptatretus burgeri TaxID=7764 RepID=A0A8C4QYB8_EPTBU
MCRCVADVTCLLLLLLLLLLLSSAHVLPHRSIPAAVSSSVQLPCTNTDPKWLHPLIPSAVNTVTDAWHGSGMITTAVGLHESVPLSPPFPDTNTRTSGPLGDRRGAYWYWSSEDGRYTGQVIADVYPGGVVRSYYSQLKLRVAMSAHAFVYGDFSLGMSHLRWDDAGLYTCRLYDGAEHAISSSVRLVTVRVTSSRPNPILKGQRVTLTCGVSRRDDLSSVTWTHRDVPLQLTHTRISMTADSQSLTLKSFRQRDSGPWSCHVTLRGSSLSIATHTFNFADERPPLKSNEVEFSQQQPLLVAQPCTMGNEVTISTSRSGTLLFWAGLAVGMAVALSIIGTWSYCHWKRRQDEQGLMVSDPGPSTTGHVQNGEPPEQQSRPGHATPGLTKQDQLLASDTQNDDSYCSI